jgi:F-type H+-transporting ATPase subunit gamma
MPSLIDIRRRIRSVRNTQQITKAMKMVSAAKLRRAQDRVIASRPYGAALRGLLADVAAAASTDERVAANPLLARRPEQHVQLILITSDKGLAGAFNSNLIKAAQRFAEEHKPAATDFLLIGRKGRDFFRKRAVPITGEHLGMAKVQYEDAAAIAQKLMERFRNEEIDSVYLLYNEFKSVMAQKVTLAQVLPMELPKQTEPVDFIFETPPLEMLASLLPRYVESELYRAPPPSTPLA